MTHLTHIPASHASRTRLHNTLLTLGARPLLLPAVVLALEEVAVAAVAILGAVVEALVAFVGGEDGESEHEDAEEKEDEVEGGFHFGVESGF